MRCVTHAVCALESSFNSALSTQPSQKRPRRYQSGSVTSRSSPLSGKPSAEMREERRA